MKKGIKKVTDDKLLVMGAHTEEVNIRSVKYKETTAYDENGEVVYSYTQKPKHANGSGFVISYTEKMNQFLIETESPTSIRVFMYLAHNQSFGNSGIYGFRCSRKHLQNVLKISRISLWRSLSYLKDKFLVHEATIDGQTEFMVNPSYVTIGTDKKSRVREWELRWRMTFAQKK